MIQIGNREKINLLLLGLMTIPIIFSIVYILLFSVNFPSYDDWNWGIQLGINNYNGISSLHYLFVFGEYGAMFLPMAIVLTLTYFFPFNFVLQIFVSYGLFIFSFIILALLVKKLGFSRTQFFLIMTVISWYFFNFFIIGVILWAGTIIYMSYLFAFLATFWFLLKSEDNAANIFVAIFFAACCLLSFSPGLFIWVGGFFYLLLAKNSKKIKRLIIWILASILFYFIYFKFFYKSISVSSSPEQLIITVIQHPLGTGENLLSIIGLLIINQPGSSIFGALVIIIAIIIFILNRKSLALEKTAIWYAILINSFIVCFALTVLRGNMGMRNYPNIFLFLLPILILAFFYLINPNKTSDLKIARVKNSISMQKRTKILIFVIILILFSISISSYASLGIIHGVKWFNYQNLQANQFYSSDIHSDFINSSSMHMKGAPNEILKEIDITITQWKKIDPLHQDNLYFKNYLLDICRDYLSKKYSSWIVIDLDVNI